MNGFEPRTFLLGEIRGEDTKRRVVNIYSAEMKRH